MGCAVPVQVEGPPPNDAGAERLILCGFLREWPQTYVEVRRAGCDRGDLYHDAHRRVWDAAVGADNAGEEVGVYTVWRRLGLAGDWPEWGDATGRGCAVWLVDLLGDDPTGYWAMEGANRVRDLAVRRAAIHRARRLIRDALAGVPVAELVAV